VGRRAAINRNTTAAAVTGPLTYPEVLLRESAALVAGTVLLGCAAPIVTARCRPK